MIGKFSATALAIVLAGCGGGGSTTTSSSALSFPVEATILKVVTSAATYSGNFNDSTGSYALSVSIAPAGLAQFTSTSPSSRTYTTTTVLRKNGAISTTATSTTYFTTGPLAFIGIRSGNDPTEVKQKTALPASAQVGTAGAFFSGTRYPGNQTLFTDQVNSTWSLEPDSATTAFLCITTSYAGSFVQESESDCFRIDTAGSILGFKATTTTNARSTNTNRVIDTFTFQ